MTTGSYDRKTEIEAIRRDWAENPRWANVTRNYQPDDVVRLRGSVKRENTLARRGAEKLWELVNGGAAERFGKDYVNCLGALTGGQAVQQVKAGIQAIYLSGWQVAADNNSAFSMYPDQSLYPVDSVPKVIERINNSFARADQIQWQKGIGPGDDGYIDYFAPVVADAEAGFGGVLNAYELMRAMIAAGAAGVHFEDQLASVKKCGHMGGKVLVPTREAVQKLCRGPAGSGRRRGAHRWCWRGPTLMQPTCMTIGCGRKRRGVHRPASEPPEGFLPNPRRDGSGNRPRPGLRALCRPSSGARRPTP